jgi:hypothetical protein
MEALQKAQRNMETIRRDLDCVFAPVLEQVKVAGEALGNQIMPFVDDLTATMQAGKLSSEIHVKGTIFDNTQTQLRDIQDKVADR